MAARERQCSAPYRVRDIEVKSDVILGTGRLDIFPFPPTPTLPHKGGGGLVSPSPLVGEGWGGGPCFSLPPCGGGLGWGGLVSPSPLVREGWGGGALFLPPPLWGRVGVGGLVS